MPRKTQRTSRKASCHDNQNKTRYQEKAQPQWKCGVCDKIYSQNETHC